MAVQDYVNPATWLDFLGAVVEVAISHGEVTSRYAGWMSTGIVLPLILTAAYEDGTWNDELGESDAEWGWAVIMLGLHEVARVALPWHQDYQRREAIEKAAAEWLAGRGGKD